MSRLSERLVPLRERIVDLQQAVGRVPQEAQEAADQAVPEALARLSVVLRTLLTLAVETAPEMVTQLAVDQLLQRLNQLSALLPQLETDPATAATTIDSETESLVATTATWATLPQADAGTGADIGAALVRTMESAGGDLHERVTRLGADLTQSESTWRASREQIDQSLSAAVANLNAEIGTVRDSLTAEKQRLDALVSQQQEAYTQAQQRQDQGFAASQQGRDEAFQALGQNLTASAQEQTKQLQEKTAADLQELQTAVGNVRDAVTAEKQRLDAVVQQQQQQFAKSEEERRKEFDALRKDVTTKAATQGQELRDNAAGHIDALRSILEEAQRVANAIANTGTATAFGGDAQKERIQANAWRIAALVIGMLGAAFAGITLVWRPLESGSLSVGGALGRATVALVIGALATYAGRQSAEHRRREVRSRRLELELTAFGPFIEGLDQETKNRLRVEFVGRLFKGAEETDASDGSNGVLGGEQVTLFGNIVDVVLKAVRAK